MALPTDVGLVLSSSTGMPVTRTGLLNATVMLIGVVGPYGPSSSSPSVDVTLRMDGLSVSIAMSPEPPSEPGPPAGGSSRCA